MNTKKMVQNCKKKCEKRLFSLQNGQTWSKWSKMVKMVKNYQNGIKWSKIVQIGPSGQKLLLCTYNDPLSKVLNGLVFICFQMKQP